MHPHLKSLLEAGNISSSSIEVPLEGTISISDFKRLPYEEALKGKDSRIVVCDNAKWVVANVLDENGNPLAMTDYTSGDGVNPNIVYRHVRRSKFTVYQVSEVGLAPGPLEALYINNNIPRGEIQMDIPNLDKIAEEASKGLTAPAAPQLNSFEGQEGDVKPTGVTNAVIAAMKGIAENTKGASQLQGFHAYMKEHALLTAYVVRSDAAISSTFTAKAVDNAKLIDNANEKYVQMVRENNGSTTGVPVRQLDHTIAIGFKQSRPGPILGVVVKAPIELGTDPQSLADPGFEFKPSKEVILRDVLLKKDEAFSQLVVTNPYGIKENPATHTNPGIMTIEGTVYLNSKTKNHEERRRFVHKDKGLNYLTPGNYFPINTFLTVDVTDGKELSADEVKGLNVSAFYTFLKGMKQSGSRYSRLTEEYKAQLAGTQDEFNIVSKYFAPVFANRTPIEVKPFFDTKGAPLAKVKIPVKQLVAVKAKEGATDTAPKFRSVPVRIDATKKEVIEKTNEFAALSSLYAPEFQTVRTAAGEALSSEKLTRLVRTSGGTKKAASANTMSAAEMMKLQLSRKYDQTQATSAYIGNSFAASIASELY